MKIKIFVIISLLLCSIGATSQNEIPNTFEYFGPYKVFVNGNNFLKSRKAKYNNDNAIRNEDTPLYQIDADKDKMTFSSTAISINIPPNATIEKAMIVLAYNHNFCFVNDKKGKKPIVTSTLKPNDGTIKFKPPFESEYTSFEVDTLVDNSAYNNLKDENKYKPSVFSIDVTNILKGKKNVNGLYWLANYYAIQGQTLSGLSSGWSMVIVYKAPNIGNNLICGQIGYTEIDDKSSSFLRFPKAKNTFPDRLEIPFSLTMLALGGDPGEGNENFYWSSARHEKTIDFKDRYSTDVLNGTIDNFGTRVPNFTNNFGLDILQGKGVLPTYFFENNNTSGITLGIDSKDNNEKIQLIYSILEMPYNENPNNINIQRDNITQSKDFNIVNNSKRGLDFDERTETQENGEDVIIKTYRIPDLDTGYYVINGVFSIENNRKNWIKRLNNTSNYSINYFNNSVNNFDYIFCHFTKDINEAKKQIYSIKKRPNFEESWILEVQN